MLNYIVGKVNYKNSRFIIVESNWTGYYINIVDNDYFELNQTKRVYLSEIWKISNKNLIQRELYGFSDLETKLLFNSLQTVSGIGPKTAITILKNGSKTIIRLIKTNNAVELARLPGLNTNLAKSICTTLAEGYLYSAKAEFTKNQPFDDFKYSIGDLTEALLVLGYQKDQIQTAISYFESTEKASRMDISAAVASCIQIIMNQNSPKIKESVDNV